MTKDRIVAPPRDEWKTEGHEAHFESIEATTGQTVQYWLDQAAARLDEDEDYNVAEWLKTEHGLGDAHANAIIGYATNSYWR